VEHGRVVVFAIDAIVHEDYNQLNVDNDIALLKLSESVSGPSKIENMIIFVLIKNHILKCKMFYRHWQRKTSL